ncbi:hypothetical protein NFI96_010284 [Prochilodus magdalenae]|nr:hypothetical protein NFI96_010284 [Prochilodus magdalenae]
MESPFKLRFGIVGKKSQLYTVKNRLKVSRKTLFECSQHVENITMSSPVFLRLACAILLAVWGWSHSSMAFPFNMSMEGSGNEPELIFPTSHSTQVPPASLPSPSPPPSITTTFIRIKDFLFNRVVDFLRDNLLLIIVVTSLLVVIVFIVCCASAMSHKRKLEAYYPPKKHMPRKYMTSQGADRLQPQQAQPDHKPQGTTSYLRTPSKALVGEKEGKDPRPKLQEAAKPAKEVEEVEVPKEEERKTKEEPKPSTSAAGNGCCCPRPGVLVLCESLGLHALPRSVPLTTSALSVARNRLCNVDNVLWRYSSLQELSLSHNWLDRFPRGLPPSLESLQLGENRITYITAGALRHLGNLTRLDLEDNRIRAIQPGALLGLGRLKMLSLKGNRLTTLPLHLPSSLIHLDVSANCISALDLASLATLVNLQVLKINSNCLRSVPEHAFDGLMHLRSVELANNLWVCECDIMYLYRWLLMDRNTFTS